MSLSFDDDDPLSDQFIEEPIHNIDDNKKDISEELTKLMSENTNLRRIIHENDKKYQSELDATIKEKDDKIDKLNEELEKLKEDNKFLESDIWRSGANDFAVEVENKDFARQIIEKNKEIDKLIRFRKATYYVGVALITLGAISVSIKIGLNYYF
jgi:chromosome segregation ATPase